MTVSQGAARLGLSENVPRHPSFKKLIFLKFSIAYISLLGCRITSVQVSPRSREFSLSIGTSPLSMRLFFRVHENRIFIMSDFRDFFHAQHRRPFFWFHFWNLRSFGIKTRELLIFKRSQGTSRFSPYFAFFFLAKFCGIARLSRLAPFFSFLPNRLRLMPHHCTGTPGHNRR